jgi:Ca-activated chloride channel family protein
MLAFDVSSSMTATDLTPTRMDAAKAAARTVVERQPPTVRIGVVAFGSSGLVTQQPTADRASVLAAIDRLQPAGGTALGSGLQTSLSAITGKPVLVDAPGSPGGSGGVEPQGPDLGYHGSAAVVLFSDGENTAEPDPVDVAELASSAGVRVYPVGIGSPQGTVIEVDGFQLATALDEPTLRAIADRTDGRYVAGADPAALAGVADAIDLEWKVETEHIEVTALLAAAAGLLVLAGFGLSLVWFGRAV